MHELLTPQEWLPIFFLYEALVRYGNRSKGHENMRTLKLSRDLVNCV